MQFASRPAECERLCLQSLNEKCLVMFFNFYNLISENGNSIAIFIKFIAVIIIFNKITSILII